jgi:hypothetical protein
MADLLAAQVQRDNGVMQNTKDKETRAWKRWQEYARIIEYDHDIVLTYLSPQERAAIMGAFAAALRRRQFFRPDEKNLAASTVQETVGKLGEIFRANVGYNPTHGLGSDGFHPALARQFKGMRNEDPGKQQQKGLPVCVYRELHRRASLFKSTSSDMDEAIADILTLAYFFCMRSCEYANVQGERRTKILCIRNLRFFNKNNKDIGRPNLIIETQINTVKMEDTYYHIPGSTFLSKIRSAIATLGHEKLGFHPEDVGTHSNRSGGYVPCRNSGLYDNAHGSLVIRFLYALYKKTSSSIITWHCIKNAHP